MHTVLVVYHSGEGQTAKIAERLAAVMREEGAAVDVAPAAANPAPRGYDLVVAGDSIHAGHHSAELTDYLSAHAAELAGLPTALFQVCLTSATRDTAHDATAAGYVDELRAATGFEPDRVGLFAGAIAYTRYGWAKRQLMKLVVRREGGSTDTSRDHDLTDWAEVDRFARELAATATPPAR